MQCINEETAELVLQALQGRQEAFEKLLNLHVPSVVGFLRHLSATQEEVEEIAHMTFIRVYQNLSSYDRTRPFIPWVFSIAKNLFLNERRRISRRNAFVQKGILPSTASVEETAVNRVQTAEILSTLTEEAKLLVELKVFQQLSFGQIAELLGEQEGTVRVRFHRLLSQLRQKNEKGEQPS